MATILARWRPARSCCVPAVSRRPRLLPPSSFARPFTCQAWRSKSETTPADTDSAKHLDPIDRATYDSLSPEERDELQLESKELHEHMKQPAVEARLNAVVANAAYAVESERPRPANPPEKWVPSFVGMYEEDEKEWPKDDDFMEDDMTSHGHGNLEQHREIREYARITAWEMPLLSKLSKPFAPPAADHPLRFRYTTYMGEQHPAEKKIVLEFCTRDLPDLNETQRSKLVKLVGVRYNPDSDIVKMSCEMFDTQAQNKRYLGDLVDTLVREAKDERDTFADVPFDFRHHKPKRQPRFPDQWLLTPERRKYLEESRQQRLQLDEERERKGALVDGLREIERAVVRMPDVSAVAQSIGSGKQKGGAKRLVKARQ